MKWASTRNRNPGRLNLKLSLAKCLEEKKKTEINVWSTGPPDWKRKTDGMLVNIRHADSTCSKNCTKKDSDHILPRHSRNPHKLTCLTPSHATHSHALDLLVGSNKDLTYASSFALSENRSKQVTKKTKAGEKFRENQM